MARITLRAHGRGPDCHDRGATKHLVFRKGEGSVQVSMSDWEAEQVAQRAFSGALPVSMPLGQKMVLWALFLCAKRQDRPVEEPHAELAALAGLDLAGYFTCLLKLKFAGFVTDDGQDLRIDHIAIRAVKAADGAPKKALKQGRGRSSGLA
jgi:hypothetical protein